MCYDVKTSLEAQLKRAKRNQDLKAIEEIVEKLGPLTDLPLHHASGFSHPEVLIYTNQDRFYPIVATWGLIPHWVNNVDQQKKIWNSTLNARVETIFEKPLGMQLMRNVVYFMWTEFMSIIILKITPIHFSSTEKVMNH